MWRSSVKNALALPISFPKARFTVFHTCFTYIIPKGAFHSFPYLHIIAVKKEYRNKGIGKALLEYSENIANEVADKLFLVVADYNPDAKRFYERNGYQQVGEIPNLYRPGVTEYLMAKDLKSD